MEPLQLTTSSIPPLITSLLLMLVAVVTAVGSRGSRVGQYFIIWVLTLATWLFFAAFFYSADTPERAMDFVLAAHVGITFIPIAGLSFALVATNHPFSRSRWMIAPWLGSFLFLFLMLTTNQMFSGIREYDWGYYPVYGPAGIVFVTWFCVSYLLAAAALYQAWRNAATESIAKKRYRGLLFNYGFSMLGALDFLPTIGVNYLPLGWAPVLVYSLGALYLLYRYPLTDVSSAYTSEQVINSVGSGLLLIDQDHVVRFVNRASGEILGIDPDKITGRPIELGLSSDLLGYRIRELLIQHDSVVIDIPITNSRTGEWQVIKVMINEVHNETGARVGSLCIFQDVTESRRNRSDLEALVTRRTYELEAMRDRALEASQAKSAFLASMSHELRTPLNAIIGYSEMMSEDFDELGKDLILGDLDKVQSAARHLLGLINNILDLSKIEAGKMEVHNEDTDLQVLVQDIRATIGPLIKKNGNRLTITGEEQVGQVRIDSVKLKQILLNLLSNAARFTRDGDITLGISRVDPHQLGFDVIDTGIGIDQEEIGRLFVDYHQADSTGGKFGGTGLGLAIVQRFVELMGGTVDVESTPGKGARFRVTLPG